ncbi:MAG TPA: hypothetical protein VEP69_01110 [Thermodesulfovibrionales bacterium]|nr:hypothetical protein [Thermodesulfovibrionales bacterium]
MKTIRFAFLCAALPFFGVMAGTCPAAAHADNNIAVPGHAVVRDRQVFHIPGLSDGSTGNAVSSGFSGEGSGQELGQYSLLERQADMFRVLSALETRVGDSALLDKVRHKLPELTGRRLKMIASLSDHMEGSRQEPGNNVAFLLIATLIIFS